MMTLRCLHLSLAICLSCCGISFAEEPATDAEIQPTFKGRTFEEWKRLLPNDLDWETRADAYRAVRVFSLRDEYAIPAMELVKANLPKEQAASVILAAYKSLPAGTPAERTALRIAGIRGKHKAHRSAIVKSLAENQWIPVEEATEELADAVAEALRDEDVIVRCNAVQALGHIAIGSDYKWVMNESDAAQVKIRPEGEYGPVIKKSLPLLQKLMNDGEARVRSNAIHTLAQYPSDLAVEALTKQLKELLASPNIIVAKDWGNVSITSDEDMVREIVGLLKRHTAHGNTVLPVLKSIQNGDNPRLKRILGSSLNATIAAIEANPE